MMSVRRSLHTRDPGHAAAGAGSTDFSPLLWTLVSVLTLVVLELMRSSGPFVDYAFARGKLPGAIGAGLATYLVPGLVVAGLLGIARRRLGTAMLVGVGVLTAMRLLGQALDGQAKLYVGLSTVAVGIGVLVLAVSLLAGHAGGGRAVAAAIGVGAAGGVGLQLALGTWDAFWRYDTVGWVVSAAIATTMAGMAVALAIRGVPQPKHLPRRLWALGPLLALLLMMLANPAFAASQAGAPLALAGSVLGLGLLVAARVAHRGPQVPPLALMTVPAVLVGTVMALGNTTAFDRAPVAMAALVMAALLCAQIAVFAAAAAALGPSSASLSVGRLAGGAALTGLGAILPVMLYQVAYEVPLGFPNEWVVVAAATALGLGTLRTRDQRSLVPVPVTGVLVAAALLTLGTTIATANALTARHQPVDGAAGSGVVMVWNIHYAVDSTGALDPEAIAQVVETYDPDVLLVNEISSGWVLGGGLDVGTWLSQRLDRPVAFAPAADRQFGNGVLSRWQMDDVEVHRLPQGDGSQERTALSARVLVGRDLLEVVSVQLQNKAANAPTRVIQAGALLDAIGDSDPVIIGGDLNANPGTEAIETLTDAGLVSSLDTLGKSDALTYPSTSPEQRLDWVLGRDIRFVRADVLEQVTSADHLPIVVTVRY